MAKKKRSLLRGFPIPMGLALAAAMLMVVSTTIYAASTRVPGHNKDRTDTDGNGISDAGIYVNGHYTSLYAYDAAGDYYWDLGDGRIQGTVDSVEDLNQNSLTTCDYVVNYRADFGNDPFMDEGWIQNHINCSGAEKGQYNSLIVSQTDPRYEGNPDEAIWGTWEYHVDTWSQWGNVLESYKGQTL